MCVFYRVSRGIECGWSEFLFQLSALPMVQTLMGEEVIKSSKQLSISSHIEEGSADVVAIKFHHIFRVLIMLISGYVVGLVALTFEIDFNKDQKRNVKIHVLNVKRKIVPARNVHSA